MSEFPPGVGKEILFEVVDGHIAVVTLNRPEKRNAVNGAMTEAVDYLVRKIDADDSIRVAILASSNDKAFCAGADLEVISTGIGGPLATPEGSLMGFALYPKKKPWIAAVRGVALAGGCELALGCDMIVCSTQSAFGLPEVKRGLYAGAGGVHRLPRALPRNIGIELLITGDPLPAERAYQLGLVNRLAAPDKVDETALELARAIAANAPLAVRETLRVGRLSDDLTSEAMIALSAEASPIVMGSNDAKEGPRAFLEKRKPHWTGT